jgi:hypothetical protein
MTNVVTPLLKLYIRRDYFETVFSAPATYHIRIPQIKLQRPIVAKIQLMLKTFQAFFHADCHFIKKNFAAERAYVQGLHSSSHDRR